MDKCRIVYQTQIQEIAKALSSELRIRILEEISSRQMSISQLAQVLSVAQPTVSINVQILESAGLIRTALGMGREKILLRSCDSVLLHLPTDQGQSGEKTREVLMPVGMYSFIKATAPCGLVGREGMIGIMDDPKSFFLPERYAAELVYFSEDGYVEYLFPNPLNENERTASICFSAEMCSEALGFQQYYPSDITLLINNKIIGTWTSTGDYGDRRGKLNPDWWGNGSTQYGELVEWSVDGTGSYLNGRLCSEVVPDDLSLKPDQPVTVRLEVMPDALNRRGLNLFGAGFGDHRQGLKLTFSTDEKRE